MNKKLLLFLFLLSVALFFIYSNKIKQNILYLFNSAKESIITSYDMSSNAISRHFDQSEKITKLNEENKHLHAVIESLKTKIIPCQRLQEFSSLREKNATFVQTISYAHLPDISKIYINYPGETTSPLGLIHNGAASGIVTESKNGYALALLNDNTKTTYTVFIGKDRTPGVLFGSTKPLIRYIPKYKKISLGDKVVTSGLDGIFYEGVNVGIVEKINQKELYQEAIITPTYNSLHPEFFYVIE